MTIEDLAYNADPNEVLAIKDELIALYYRELFEKQVYLGQIRKLSGEVIEILKKLEVQEEEHARLLMVVLSKANVKVDEYVPKTPLTDANAPLSEAVSFDIEQETISTAEYLKATNKASPKLKELLDYIMQEELNHIKLLRDYLEKVAKESKP